MLTETLETFGVTQHLTPLLRQGDQRTADLVLSGYTDCKYLLSFLTSGHPTQRRQTKRHASGIQRLPHPVLFGHPEKRLDAVRADRQADLIETELLGRFQLELQVGPKLPAHGHRSDR